MSIRELFNELKANNLTGRTRNDLLANLYKTPHRERGSDMAHFQTLMPNTIHQADLVFLPHDHGYKYLLVVIDACNRKFDAIPLKVKESDVVAKAFKVIYEEHNILKFPKLMQFDNGSEFKGDVKDYFYNHEVDCRYAPTARHRMQGLVERLNQTIGTLLMKRMTSEELLTHQPSVKWVSDVGELIEVLNENRNKKFKEMDLKKESKPDVKKPEKIDEPIYTKESGNIIPIGTEVRTTLDYPIDVGTGKRVIGSFRSGDIRWSPKIRTVKEVLIRPNIPPMYLLDGNVGKQRTDTIARSFQQLQTVEKNEKPPSKKYIRKETKKEKEEEKIEPVSKYPTRERKAVERFTPP